MKAPHIADVKAIKIEVAESPKSKRPSPTVAMERRSTEEALRESEARFRTIFEYSPVAIFVTDLENTIIDANPAACQLHGSKRAQLLGQSVLDLIPPEQRTKTGASVPKFARGEWHLTQSFAWTRRGEAIPIAVTASRIEYAGRDAVLLHVRDVSEHKRTEARLRNSREQLRALSRRVENAREKERRRIAREVHDELGQALTGLKLEVAWLGKHLVADGRANGNAKFLSKIESMSGLIDETLQSVRKITTELRPGVLDALGLVAAVEWQAQEFQNRTGIRCRARTTSRTLTMEPEVSTAVFRIFQEILRNVVRHAHATKVEIELKATPSNLLLVVRDNGRGISELEGSAPSSLGLLGMRERALAFGGEVEICGIPAEGTIVTVYVPIAGETIV
jgi:PAS domain S-box-containing protein